MQDNLVKTVIRLNNVTYQYPQGESLHFADLEVPSGQHTLILGDSGSGKTTLLHILSGLLKPTTGMVDIDGQPLYELPARKLDEFRGQRIGLIFQEAHLVKSLTIKENMQIAQGFAGAKVDNTRINEVLALLNLDHKADSYPNKLSRGQMQRAAIARAVINKPAILVADEPTASLDDRNTESVLNLLLTQADQQGATLVIATHDKRVKNRITRAYEMATRPALSNK
ncbi:ABC transporter ATP-binding protein [Parapedobacter sp. ISTM3]|uniref:Putative ABC transport system ATP-binding protein n=1 Tax=Parapedobacter luteus TaxID=623280 RepID=A0A1T5AHY8_9SPHI|nr:MULTISPECIES: ABC transporter ATP-binding protein [Parapedobacter]MBK1441798.1 ABC transporter ATP-binding protein [Parapedobacter sp. ISTM3]SKB34479.1 putative ABC transport system ATP-binding protein [Parapedobacter luteus]